jgi:GNAT superfamily N-acetyltransferase
MSDPHTIMSLELRAVLPQDTELLLEFMAGFNQEENIVFDAEVYRARVHAAFQCPQLVKIWLIAVESSPVGYAVLAFTFSFEFGGIQATIDEIYLQPAERRKGLGTLILQRLEQEASHAGAKTLWGDIADEKPGLTLFYERAGFDRYPYRPYSKPLMT